MARLCQLQLTMIEYKNDGKQKERSHEGHMTLTGSTYDLWWTSELAAYGPNQAHVRMHLRSGIDEMITELVKVRDFLSRTDL